MDLNTADIDKKIYDIKPSKSLRLKTTKLIAAIRILMICGAIVAILSVLINCASNQLISLKSHKQSFSCLTEEYRNCFTIDTGKGYSTIINKCIGISIDYPDIPVYWLSDEWRKDGQYVAYFACVHTEIDSTKKDKSDIVLRALPKTTFSIASVEDFISRMPNVKSITPRDRKLDVLLFSKKVTTTCDSCVIITSVFSGDDFYILLSLITKNKLQGETLPIFMNIEESLKKTEGTPLSGKAPKHR
jgi:hypothetical protein